MSFLKAVKSQKKQEGDKQPEQQFLKVERPVSGITQSDQDDEENLTPVSLKPIPR